MTNIHKKAANVGLRQRDALFAACHGPATMLKGHKAQLAGLVKQGLLNPDLTPTDDGTAVYDLLTTPIMFDSANNGSTDSLGYRHAYWYGTVSADGNTVYFARHGSRDAAIAVVADSIPDMYWGDGHTFGIDRPMYGPFENPLDELERALNALFDTEKVPA